nr:hypothetical protein BaRGS_025563 [Batillaria attramentaria]
MKTTLAIGSLDGGVQGETITLSLEEASQIILQQGGLEGAVQLSDGTYQILGQQLIQVTREDGSVDTQALPVEVVQALSGGLMGFANMETTQEQAVQGEDDTDPTSLEAPQQVVVKEEPTEAKPVEPKPDFNCPIEVTERTEIMIKGKKCVLMQNPETKQLCAYPILPPEGPDSVRRSGRKRKKAKVFDDYDVLEASSDDEPEGQNDDEKDPEVTMYGIKKRQIKRELPQLASPFMMREKDRSDGDTSAGGDGQQPTVIQIPDNLLPMFGIKKDPIKIGVPLKRRAACAYQRQRDVWFGVFGGSLVLKARESELEKLKCPKCDFQGYYVQQYQDHIASHAGDIHKCKCCNFLTFNKDDLLHAFQGQLVVSLRVTKLKVILQGQGGECQGQLVESRVVSVKDQYILKMHVKMVHMPAEVLFECTVCGKKFTRKAHLKRHLRIHDPEKPFKCPHCDYRGCERSDISKHLLIHEDPKHVCEVCGKAFRHIKNKELHVKRHNGQRDYKCGVCDFYGYTFTDIRKHIERKHSDIKTLVCEKCAMPFKSELQLREHQKDNCEVLMIEQALAIATSSGRHESGHHPDPLHLRRGRLTLYFLSNALTRHGEEDTLSEDQMVEATIADVTSSGHVMDSDNPAIADGTIQIIPNDDIEEVVDLPHETMVSLG